MERLVEVIVAALQNVPVDRLNTVVALSGMALAAFAIYAVLVVARIRK
jgi:hypothetical protein